MPCLTVSPHGGAKALVLDDCNDGRKVGVVVVHTKYWKLVTSSNQSESHKPFYNIL